jgi:glycosyltransferase involved in cell wall biosynthesis
MRDRSLRVALDARCLNTDHLRGIGKSLYEFVNRTSASGAIEWHLLSNRPDLPIHVPDQRCQVSVFETRGYRFATWEQFALPRKARKLGVDLLHTPSTSTPWWQPVPTVVTIHDAIPWLNDTDEAWPRGFYRDRLLPSAFRRAAAIVTVSESSRRDILARWPALKTTLHVVSLGVDERYFEAVNNLRPIVIGNTVVSEPYLLYLGGSDPRKRLMWALQAWWSGEVARTATMVVCGVEQAKHETFRRSVPRELRERLIMAPFVAEEDMPRLYMRAAAVVYPSLYEGFGLPVIEAQAVGTPVVFSEVGSLAELKGPGAVVLPVDDLQAWARALNLLVQPQQAPGPNRVARAWARQFSWDAFSDRMLAVYQAVATPTAAPRGHDQHLSEGARP